MAWRFQEAKQWFTEFFARAGGDRPARVTEHSRDLLELIRAAPDFELLDLQRVRDSGRL